jgi:hypothetical protein
VDSLAPGGSQKSVESGIATAVAPFREFFSGGA